MILKMKLLAVGVLSGFALLAVVPATVNAHGNYEEPSGSNIVETAVAINKETGEFSTLIAAVSCTNLVNRLQNEHREFTVFAPTDAAFAKLGLNAGNVCTSFDKPTLSNILRYHVTRGSKSAEEVLSCNRLIMLNHQRADIVGATIDGQNIIQTDVKASNGIIHVIDGVMLP